MDSFAGGSQGETSSGRSLVIPVTFPDDKLGVGPGRGGSVGLCCSSSP